MITAADIHWELADPPPAFTTADDFVVDVVLEAVSYRTLAQQAIHYAAALAKDLQRSEVNLQRLRDEYRDFRASMMRRPTGEAA